MNKDSLRVEIHQDGVSKAHVRAGREIEEVERPRWPTGSYHLIFSTTARLNNHCRYSLFHVFHFNILCGGSQVFSIVFTG